MSTEPDLVTETQEPPAAVNAYLTLGLAAVVAMGVALLQTGADRWSIVPTLVGAAGLAFRWRSAPLVLLSAVAFALAAPWLVGWRPSRWAPPLAAELALGAAVLAYVLAQYRLFGLTLAVYPPDPRRPAQKPPPRDAGRVPAREVSAALVTVVAAAVGAVFVWEVVGGVAAPWNIPPRTWRVGLLAWVLATGLVLLASVLGYLGWRRLSAAEASLYVRDVLWYETRREQRRINRWRAWALRRRERRR
jgi:hypothetical protein